MGNTSPYRARTPNPDLQANKLSKKAGPAKAEEFKFFNKLPDALKGTISNSLAVEDAARLSCSSKAMNLLLQHPPAVPMAVRQFLHHVARGEHAAMQEMLRANIHLLYQRGSVNDCSGRYFASISGFEYALWALDRFMWEDMLACLPREEGHLTEDGRKVVEALLRQYKQIQAKGVSYRLNGMPRTESHYGFSIVNALQEQVNMQNALGDKNWKAIDKQWREDVGGALHLLPMHVVDEYCSDTPFYPVPQFDSRPRPAQDLRQFYNWLSGRWEDWFGINSKLSSLFAIYKGGHTAWGVKCGRGGPLPKWVSTVTPVLDLNAMTALCETRNQDFTLLEAQLNSLLDVEEQPRPGI